METKSLVEDEHGKKRLLCIPETKYVWNGRCFFVFKSGIFSEKPKQNEGNSSADAINLDDNSLKLWK